MTFPWTEEAERLAHRLYCIEGKSARDTADVLGQGCTRNAVIGKAHRLGWGRDHRRAPSAAGRAPVAVKAPRPPKPPKSAKAPRPARRPRETIASLGMAPQVVGIDYRRTAASESERAARRRAGLDVVAWVETGAGVDSPNARPFLEGQGCKWPLNGGLSCCNPIRRGMYCAGHAAVAYEGDEPAGVPERLARRLTRHDGVIPAGRREAERAFSPWDEGRVAA